jgi:hypothetical protein
MDAYYPQLFVCFYLDSTASIGGGEDDCEWWIGKETAAARARYYPLLFLEEQTKTIEALEYQTSVLGMEPRTSRLRAMIANHSLGAFG